MYPMRTLIPLLFLNAVTGFTIPANQADGVYMVRYENGQEIHTLLYAPVNKTEIAESTVKRRTSVPDTFDNLACGDYKLDPTDTDNAVEQLKRQCNPGAIGGGLDFYSIWGSTVAYLCNFGGNAIPCTRDGLAASFADVTGLCGLYGAGWGTQQTATDYVQTGYEDRNARFCGRGTNGK
ncbi:hypothetical protein GQ53DRAFT_817066 [Thozetella sp. PMI_491]|nr:hypothetical protein GQ53DRAFT_817066 [Thozetella sp. PMI_491]